MGFFGNVDFQKLTYTEKGIYNYLKANTEKVPYMHVRDVAQESHAGTSSVMRLVHKLGYDSYTDFRNSLKRQQQKEVPKDRALLFPNLSADMFPVDFQETLENIADQIMECDNLIFTGIGASGRICDYAARRFAGIGINTFSFSDVTYPISSKLKNTANNIVIALSISGENNEIVEVLNTLAPNKDITIVAVTPKADSTIARLSDIVIPYQVSEHRIQIHFDMTSQIPAIFVLEVLSSLVFHRSNAD